MSSGTPARLWLKVQSLKRIEVSLGRRHPVGKSLILGTGIGAGAGVLLGLVSPLCEPSGELFDCLLSPTTRSQAVEFYAVTMGLGGLLTGVIVGAIGHEAWAPASMSDWRPTLTTGRATIRLGVAIPFGR
jgi:hypothetical protein